jgi:hypothetical protein
MHEANVVVLINLHERVKPKLLRDPKSLLKVSMLVEMLKVDGLLRTYCLMRADNHLVGNPKRKV